MFQNLIAAWLVALALSPGLVARVAAAPVDDAATAYRRGDYVAALALLRPLADQGLAIAQYNLGNMYYRGQGVPQDFTAAAGWFRRGAEQGFADAQNNLGNMYANGQGVPQGAMRDFG